MCLYLTCIEERMNLPWEGCLPAVVEEAPLMSRLSASHVSLYYSKSTSSAYDQSICISCLLWLVEMPRFPHCQSLSYNHVWELPLRYGEVSEKFFSILSSSSVSVCFCKKITQVDQFTIHRNSSLLDPQKSRIKVLLTKWYFGGWRNGSALDALPENLRTWVQFPAPTQGCSQ